MKTLRHVLLFLPLLLSAPAFAQWSSHGPNGGIVYNFYRESGRIWAATSGGVFSSGDDGASWSNPATSPAVFGCDEVRSVAVNGPDIYAGTSHSGVYHSLDGGGTWTATNSGLRFGFSYDVAITGFFAFALRADSGALYRTPDRGLTWMRVTAISGNPRVLFLSQHNNILYTVTATGLYISNDGGVTFTAINSAVADLGRMDWSNDTLYTATASGIKRSVNYGSTFSPVTVSATGYHTSLIAASGSYLYSAASGPTGPLPDTLLSSSNGGTTLSVVPPFTDARINALTADGSVIVAGTSYGIFRSANGGTTWSRADSGFHATAVRSLASSGSNLFAAAYPMGVFFSGDSAASWQHRGNRSVGIDGDVRSVAARNQFVHVATPLGYFRSSNFGSTWMPGATGLPVAAAASSVAVSPGSSEVLLVMGGDLYYSNNDGAAFTAVATSGLPAGTATAIYKVDTGYFAVAGNILYQSGSTLTFSATTGITGSPTSVLFMDSLYYAGTAGNGLWISRNGSTWTAMNYPAPYTSSIRVAALASDSGYLFAGTDNGILRILPSGLNSVPAFTQEGLQGHSVSSLNIMGHHLFAGTCNGVWSAPYPPIVVPVGVGNTAGINASLILYPNPAAGIVHVQVTMPESASGAVLRIKNMVGKTVYEQRTILKAGVNNIVVDAGNLPAGMYLLQLRSGVQQQTARLVIAH